MACINFIKLLIRYHLKIKEFYSFEKNSEENKIQKKGKKEIKFQFIDSIEWKYILKLER